MRKIIVAILLCVVLCGCTKVSLGDVDETPTEPNISVDEILDGVDTSNEESEEG